MNKEIERMPIEIFKEMYFKKDSYKVINENDIFLDIDKDVNDYFNTKEEFYRRDIINNKTRGLKECFMTGKLRDYINSSYLINIKNEQDETEDKTNLSSLNKIIRKVKKDRKNDYTEVLDRISSIINNDDLLKENIVKVYEDMTVDEELYEVIKNEDKKEDKLTKYIKDTIRDLYTKCFSIYKEEYDKHYNNFVDGCKDEINREVSMLINDFKKREENKYRDDRRHNLVNLYDYILTNYKDHVKWVEVDNHIILIDSFKQEKDDYIFKSGTICPSRFNIKNKYNKKLYRNGTVFTMLFEEIKYNDIEKSFVKEVDYE